MRIVTNSPVARRRGWLDQDFDNFFSDFLRPMRVYEETEGRDLVPPVDVVENGDAYTVRTELPGVKKEDIDVTLEDGVLTIKAESRSETEEKSGERVIRQERRYGQYLRSLRLGAAIDEKAVKANYRDGVLELVLPKAEAVKPKKIEVKVG
jgi:HSP20 family protein